MRCQGLVSECKAQGLPFCTEVCLENASNLSSRRRERFRMAYHKPTSAQSNSRNALNITDCWDLTVVEDLKGDFSFNVAANDINTHLSSSTITKSSPQLPCCYCSDIWTVVFLIHMLRSVLYIFCICIFFFFCRQGICHLQFLYWNYLFICHHVALKWVIFVLFIGFIAPMFCCFVSLYFPQWPLRFITRADTCFLSLLFLMCKLVASWSSLPHTCLLSAAFTISDLQLKSMLHARHS